MHTSHFSTVNGRCDTDCLVLYLMNHAVASRIRNKTFSAKEVGSLSLVKMEEVVQGFRKVRCRY